MLACKTVYNLGYIDEALHKETMKETREVILNLYTMGL